MRTVFISLILIFFFNIIVNANIVEELTSLNNLYKEGAITKNEFSKAKSILLKNKDIKKSNKKIKNTQKVKKKGNKKKSDIKISEKNDDNANLTKSYISLKEFKELGVYKKIDNYPDGLFKNKMSSKMAANDAMMKMYVTFVKKPKLLEKYPEEMMKAMAYFEIFYNYELKDKKKALENFVKNYPDISWITKKKIKTLYSLNSARKTMRESLSLNMENDIEEALERYVFMHDFLKPAEKITHKLSVKEKKLKYTSSKLKANYGKLKKTLLSKSEDRIDNKDFNKQFKKNTKDLNKVFKKISNINPKTDAFYKTLYNSFNQLLDHLNNCSSTCEKKDLITAIDIIKFNEAVLKEIEKDIIKAKYSQNMDNLNLDDLDENEKATLALISNKTKINNKKNIEELQKSILNLENSEININETLDQFEENGFEIKSVSISFDTVDNMKRWAMKDWAKSWRGELPKEIRDKSGNLVEFSQANIEDIKAQLAYNSFKNIIDPAELKDSVKNNIDENIKQIIEEINQGDGFNLDEWLNQDFSITLDNYSQLVGNSLGVDLNNFNDLTEVVNGIYGSEMTAEEYANHWQSAQYFDSTTNWGDVTMGVDLINQVGSFDAASIAKELGASLQSVADSIVAAANVGVSTDLEAAAQGLGYSNFAAAVEAYNAEHGTNYTEQSAREALGQ